MQSGKELYPVTNRSWPTSRSGGKSSRFLDIHHNCILPYREQAGGRLTLLGRYMEDVKDTDLGSKIQNMLLEIDIRLIAQKKRQIRNEIEEKKRPKIKTKQNCPICEIQATYLPAGSQRRGKKKKNPGSHLSNLM